MQKPKYIITFTVADGFEEQHTMFFEHESLAKSIYESLEENEMVFDCYLSQVIDKPE